MKYIQCKERKLILLFKRLLNFKDGVSFTALREIKVLQEIRHENVIGVFNI